MKENVTQLPGTKPAVSKSDMRKAIEFMGSVMPEQLEFLAIQNKYLKAKYDSLVKEGFTEAQAMEIVKARPIFE